MSFRMVATVAALVALVFGAAGLVLPGVIAGAFGFTIDPTGDALVRLACTSYLGFGLLAFLARDLADAGARRAVSASSAVSWGLGAVVVAKAVLAGLAGIQTWVLVAMQVVFTLAWARFYARP